MTPAMHIDVISDVVCPWCFIGKQHLAAAIDRWTAEQPAQPVSVRWHPYFLNPDTPEAGEPYRPFLERKFGGPQGLVDVWQRVSAAGKAAGIDFAFERIALRANTLAAHRLIHYAQEKVGAGGTADRADRLVESLFAAQFIDGRHVGDRTELAAVAASCGYDANEVAAVLASDRYADEVRSAAARAQQMGIGGVPFFIFNGTAATSGAQPPERLLQAMREAAAASPAAAKPVAT